MIGWHGTSTAPDTDRTANPLLQDVNIGWLQHIRTDAPAQVMSEGTEGSGKIYIYQQKGNPTPRKATTTTSTPWCTTPSTR